MVFLSIFHKQGVIKDESVRFTKLFFETVLFLFIVAELLTSRRFSKEGLLNEEMCCDMHMGDFYGKKALQNISGG